MQRRLLVTLFTAVGMTCFVAGASAQAPEIAKVPDGSVAIHYHRPGGDYDNWGVHLWETFDKVKDGKIVGPKDKSDMPLSGISWTSPMMPTGKDGFGVYWFVKANDFRNGKVNYILHKLDTKDQCGKDMFWFIETQGREAFINAGDCNIYFKAEDAMNARKK